MKGVDAPGGAAGPGAGPESVEFYPGGKLDDAGEMRDELDRLGHRVVGTVRVSVDGKEPREWAITRYGGETFGCVAVPNFGVVAHRITLVRGDSPDVDQLTVGVQVPGENRRVTATYRPTR